MLLVILENIKSYMTKQKMPLNYHADYSCVSLISLDEDIVSFLSPSTSVFCTLQDHKVPQKSTRTNIA